MQEQAGTFAIAFFAAKPCHEFGNIDFALVSRHFSWASDVSPLSETSRK